MVQQNLQSSFSDFDTFHCKNVIRALVTVFCFHKHYWNIADFFF